MASVAEMSAAQCEQSEYKCVCEMRGERIPKIVANERVAPPSAFFYKSLFN